ncbi:MAG: segregation/condensation protein A [Lachnospiraceae bacterium]|nr:segregation/condensation protein A [Lachnospiraceae bacterium]
MALAVKLEAFEGPLDLLLHLIDKNKVNIYDIPIAEITEQYLDYIREMQRQDLDIMSEFLVMAATLLDIKSRMLLPKQVDEEGEEIDPRAELVEKLLEYKMYKYISYDLKDRAMDAEHVMYKTSTVPKEILDFEEPVDMEALLDGITLSKLNQVFNTLIKRQAGRVDPVRSKFGTIEKEEFSVEDKTVFIEAYINEHSPAHFTDLLSENASKVEIIVSFLVILEMIKGGKIRVTQTELFDDIVIERIDSPVLSAEK